MNLKTLAVAICTALAPSIVFASPEDSSKSKVYIIGVIHEQKNFRNADSLLIILNNIKPDLILCEMDTLTLMFQSDYTLYKPKGWENEKRKLRFKKSTPPEYKATYLYARKNPSLYVHPFDMTIANRKEYWEFLSAKKWHQALKKAYKTGTFQGEFDSAYHSYFNYFEQYNILSKLTYSQLNRPSLVDSFRNILRTEDSLSNLLLEKVDVSSSYKEWHQRMAKMDRERDEIMAKNILYFIERTKAKKVVVLTGLLHKPFLLDELNTETDKLVLVEYFDH
ncbi:MAG: hypothetical protein WBP58_15450 [Chitinophagaceae bacterium]